MRIVETKGRIAEDGSIVLPSGVLENMRMEAGDSVRLAYLSRHPEKPVNSFGEFFLTENGVGQIAGLVEWPCGASISLPCELFRQAGMTPDGALEVRTVPGGIIIGIADPLDTVPEPLMKLFTDLGIQPEAVRKVLEKGGFPDEQW